MKMVYSTGEPVSDQNRNDIEKAFSCKLYDAYGMTEQVGLIQECERGGHHLITDYGLLEILDDRHRPVGADTEGNWVWTGLESDSMPLIRYKIGDRGIWNPKIKCECGRSYPLVDATVTRVTSS
jgi:phenylacetate-CoA ligase